MKSRYFISVLLIALIVAAVPDEATAKRLPKRAKYVFYFIGDGLGINQVYGTELYNAQICGDSTKGRLPFAGFPVRGYLDNRSASSLVTDSSAAGTALASGVKTVNGYMGVDASVQRVESLSECAARNGFGTGVVTSVEANHATPASFYAHDRSRGNYAQLLEDLMTSKVNFLAGATLIVRRTGHTRGEYFDKLRHAGIELSFNPSQAAAADCDRVVLLADSLRKSSLPYAIDRRKNDVSVVDFTESAICYLERRCEKQGFMLMVEGGKIDYACHSNDAVTVFREINDFSAAIDLALAFASRHPDNTLIVVTSDHETGGMSLGHRHYKMDFDRLVGQRCSESQLSKRIRRHIEAGHTDWESMKELLCKYLGLWNQASVSADEEAELRHIFDKCIAGKDEKVKDLYTTNEELAARAVQMLNNKAKIAWAGLSHTGMQVPFYATGAGAEELYGCRDNTDIPKVIARLMGIKLGE